MGLGKKTRFQSKLHKREVKREQYKADLIKIICIIFVVGLAASLLVLKVVSLIYPIAAQFVKDFIKSYRSVPVNPYLKVNLKHEDFKAVYFQKEPVLFPSHHGDKNAEAIWDHIEQICSEGNSFVGIDNHESDFCSGEPIVLNLSTTFAAVKDMFTPPTLITKKNQSKAVFNFKSEISIDFLLPDTTHTSEPVTPTFQQHTQSWHELIAGRKKWYLYRPGTLPSIGFNPSEPLRHWLTDVLPTLSGASRPLEIIQSEGQVLYIPEGWYHASVPLPALPSSAVTAAAAAAGSTEQDEAGPSRSTKLHSLLTSAACGTCLRPPLHGSSNTSSTSPPSSVSPSSASPSSHPPPQPYTLSIHQASLSPEIIHSEYYYSVRGQRLLSQKKYDLAIEALLQGVAIGAGVEDADTIATSSSSSSRSSSAYSEQNDFALVHALGEAYAAVGDVSRAERAFLTSIGLNRLNASPRLALVHLYLMQNMHYMARSTLALMDKDHVTDKEAYPYQYLCVLYTGAGTAASSDESSPPLHRDELE